ncbi:hypothetical protein D0809_05765 [Flavobacterium circumlabens]|uniref:Uncharacterized protein n=1 Tax=Flavobacterium circumlabens TaxID=2133765 RepID=A0A4Y7UE37_9FLAO|nr:LPO_1073/Vpar_1526 family protein [Flavobacterium circumlabens]TCN59399.1 hypothetical protein EV142_10214 [Flavobacterium circumlabens]TEB44707.1 hypothetical protein D0809_05765 [Flavobacterium circumlabens]
MFGKKNLKQEGGSDSTNLQGQNVVINNGINYSDAKEIALDVFKSNFLELSQSAAFIAKQRAEELIDDFLKRIIDRDPLKINKIQDPDIQYAIFTAQKEYAKSGEKNLEEMLIDILIRRVEENSQSLKKIVLNESLEILPKLTNEQLDILTIVFLIHETQNNQITDRLTFKNYLEIYFSPFVEQITPNNAVYKHLEYTGCCGSFGIPDDNFANLLLNKYKGLFSNGFEKSIFEQITNGDEKYNSLIINCVNNPTLYQFNAMDEIALEKRLNELEPNNIHLSSFKSLLNESTMNIDQATKLVIELEPKLEILIKVWKESYLCTMNTTSVGIMLAIVNLKRKTGLDIDANIWIK